jgi:hypothetical protein
MREVDIRAQLAAVRAELERVEPEYRVLVDLTSAYRRWLAALGLDEETADPTRPDTSLPNERPYVDPATAPGDAGTEAWADPRGGSDEPAARGPLADRAPTPEGDGIIEGSPADEFTRESGTTPSDEPGAASEG